jgi:hypothetical protein
MVAPRLAPLGRFPAVEIAVEKDLLSRGLREPMCAYSELDRRPD